MHLSHSSRNKLHVTVKHEQFDEGKTPPSLGRKTEGGLEAIDHNARVRVRSSVLLESKDVFQGIFE